MAGKSKGNPEVKKSNVPAMKLGGGRSSVKLIGDGDEAALSIGGANVPVVEPAVVDPVVSDADPE